MLVIDKIDTVVNRIAISLPVNVSVCLLKESEEDFACYWRTCELKYQGKKVTFHLTSDNFNLSDKELADLIVDPILENLKRKFKMTKDDAFKKLEAVRNSGSQDELLLNKLEALGLIKFEEEKKDNSVLIIKTDDVTNAKAVMTYRAIEALEQVGYKVIKA